MTPAWFIRGEGKRAAVGDCDLSVLHVGDKWKWLVKLAGGAVSEGSARRLVDAKRQAEAVASFCSTWLP